MKIYLRITATALLALPMLAVAAKTSKAELACVDGEKPGEPYSEHDKWGMQRYEAELARYKRDHERYLRCLDDKEKARPDSLGRKLDDAMSQPQGLPPPPAPSYQEPPLPEQPKQP